MTEFCLAVTQDLTEAAYAPFTMAASSDPPNLRIAAYRVVVIALGLIGLWMQLSIQQNTLNVAKRIESVPTAVSLKIDATHR